MLNTNCGIYKITNKINKHCYIGKSINLPHRWIEHKNRAKTEQTTLYKAMRKYGIDNFDFEILQYADPDELNELEQYYIDLYDTYKDHHGYNETVGGEGTLKYNYKEILLLWQQGYLCKDIQLIMNCSDEVIHNALISQGIPKEKIVKSHKAIAITAYDSKTKQPLKIFSSLTSLNSFFNNSSAGTRVARILKEPLCHRYFGYLWDYTKKEDYNLPILSDKEFLSHQHKCNIAPLTIEAKERLSKIHRKVEWPNRYDLKQMIRSIPFLQIGRKYGVTDNAIRKWCDKYNLPRTKKEINSYTDEEWEKI